MSENQKSKENNFNEKILTKIKDLLKNSLEKQNEKDFFYQINPKFLEGIYFFFTILNDFNNSKFSKNKNLNQILELNNINFSFKEILFFNCMEDFIDISEEILSKKL